MASTRAVEFDIDVEATTDEEALQAPRSVDERRAPRRAGLLFASLSAAGLVGFVAALRLVPGSSRRGDVAGEVLGLAARAKPLGSAGADNCNVTRSCVAPGMQCYEQTAAYAQCRGSCVPGPDPTHWDGAAWSCRELGERTPGEEECKAENEDCRQSKCCRDPGHTCFEKTAQWATCKAACTPGPSFADVDGVSWSCEKLGPTTPSTADWVAGQCVAGAGANCVEAGCCKNAGEQCFKKDEYYGECRAACDQPGWSCETVGSRTPAQEPKEEIKGMPDWALEQCSQPETGCKDSRCCIGMDVQCYEKDSTWAQCKSSCAPGPHADDNDDTWSCKPLGPRSYGASTKGFPSLYCYNVIRQGPEVGLVQAQFDRGVGIFGCDDYSLLSADTTITIGTAKSIFFPGAPITVSVDNTAGNTELFVHAWDALVAAGIWRKHTYTLKVDPDAVLLPDRVRTHVAPYVGQKMFIINCPWGDMTFGALEVYSYYAIQEWATRGHTCKAPANFGEDKYMTQCMDFLGVSRVHDFAILGDDRCLGSKGCADGVAGAYHPFKDVGSYFQCLDKATGPAPAPPAVAVQIRK